MLEDEKVYSEVLGVLLTLGDSYYSKVPENILAFLKDNCDHGYLPEYDRDKRIEELDISEEARMFLTMLKIKYWCKDEEEKNEVRRILKLNQDKYNTELRKKYNPENIFDKQESEAKTEKIEQPKKSTDIITKEEKQNWFKRFLIKIKSFFKK